MRLFEGSGVALITPFKHDQIDEATFKALIEWHIREKSDALIITGTTGESATLSKDEKLRLYEIAVKTAAGRIPIIANTGTNNTLESVLLSREAEKIGVDGLLAVAPYYNKPSQKGLFEHFNTIASAVSIPIILYNVPSRTAVSIEIDTVVALSRTENIVAIKEAGGDLERVRAIIRKTPDDFALYSGNDDLYAATNELGGKGVISVVANIAPALSHALYVSGNKDDAQARLDIMNDVLYIAPNPVPVKYALDVLGVQVGAPRLPLIPLEDHEKRQIEKALETFGAGAITL